MTTNNDIVQPESGDTAPKSNPTSLTIKDIARLAGVSIATVSKVLNHKDQDIGEDTKQKILKIISDNNYIPYQKVIRRISAKTATLGLVVADASDAFYKQFARGVEDYAYKENMSVIICNTDASESKEKKYLEILKERNVEGVLIAPSAGFSEHDIAYFNENQLPVVLVDQRGYDGNVSQVYFDYRQGTYKAAQFLLQNKHELIGYISGPLTDQDAIDRLEGYKKALYDNNISFDKSIVYESGNSDHKQAGFEGANILFSKGVTAIITSNDIYACGVYIAANEALMKIPKDMSVIGFGNSYICDLVTPSLTSVTYPSYEMGFEACATLIKQIKNEAVEKKLVYEPSLAIRHSVASPQSIDDSPKEKIVIVGSLNMDIIMKVSHIPRVGETILTNDIKNAAGGKGANQAVGAGKLGGKVYMIGRVGNDLYGRELYNSLIKNGVDAGGIVFDDMLPTGNAYIYVSDNGDNNIVVNPGANSRLSVEQVSSFDWIFEKVDYCLIQMEIPMDTIEYVTSVCRKNKVKLILNPAPAREINYEYFEDCFLVIPNETEIDLMIPGDFTIEEKAYKLLEKNFQNVIVTLGEKGCLLVNKETKQYFSAASFKAVDTTGAGDSFISGLSVALAEGKNMADAIQFASIAAGITVSREGAQPSLPDKETIKMYM
ncbi:ribokinase [Paenibacillus sp. N3.4]|uniref:ribokinase n=1 Tax=Paenibacillus sp. N3.4 TaxID=2603222 RepID=UPI0011C82ACF|nr:ribokinase [Paenibacillus sp. N3.4]TXK80029.1 ribokinase [Paenibacillus sp. N3.4]